jgi:hypothetical protein
MSVSVRLFRVWREIWSSLFIVVTPTWWDCISMKNMFYRSGVLVLLHLSFLNPCLLGQSSWAPNNQANIWLASSLGEVSSLARVRASSDTCLSWCFAVDGENLGKVSSYFVYYYKLRSITLNSCRGKKQLEKWERFPVLMHVSDTAQLPRFLIKILQVRFW